MPIVKFGDCFNKSLRSYRWFHHLHIVKMIQLHVRATNYCSVALMRLLCDCQLNKTWLSLPELWFICSILNSLNTLWLYRFGHQQLATGRWLGVNVALSPNWVDYYPRDAYWDKLSMIWVVYTHFSFNLGAYWYWFISSRWAAMGLLAITLMVRWMMSSTGWMWCCREPRHIPGDDIY